MFENPPVVRSIGKSSSGTSSGGKTSAGTNFPFQWRSGTLREHDFLAHAVVIDWIGNEPHPAAAAKSRRMKACMPPFHQRPAGVIIGPIQAQAARTLRIIQILSRSPGRGNAFYPFEPGGLCS